MNTPERQIIDPAAWLAMLAQGRNRPLAEQIIGLVGWFGQRTQSAMDPAGRQQLTEILQLILHICAQPSFQVPDDLAIAFIRHNRTFSNMAALSALKTTDACLQTLRGQPGAWAKILGLYSARNQPLDVRAVFAESPQMAAAWYVQFASAYRAGLADQTVLANLRAHFAAVPDDLPVMPGLQDVFFGSTYVDPVGDRLVKQRVNGSLRRQFSQLRAVSEPNPRKIAVLSAHWRATHSAYRIMSDFVQSLRPDYHVTFFNLGEHLPAETSGFDAVGVIPSRQGGGVPDPTPLLRNDFQVLFYPDIGMSDESLMLANMRLAPIQVAGLGHSVSTFGSEIDYFISGTDVEPADRPEQHYSERLVLLPGMGCTHKMPGVPRPAAAPEPPADALVINCPWHAQKIHFPFLDMIGRIVRWCGRPVRLQIFECGATLQQNDFLPFKEALAAVLPAEQFEVVINLPYEGYMARLQSAHLTLDSFHFGGCNTVSDSLYLGIPTVCRQGDRWYNRIGPEMLRRAGVPELVATDETSYIALALRLIQEDAWRQALRARLQATDLTQRLYGTADARYFKLAIDHLIAQHAAIQGDGTRAAIRIPRS